MRLVHEPEWETCYFEITEAEKDLLDRAYKITSEAEISRQVDSIMAGGPIWHPPADALRESPEVKALEEQAYALAKQVWHLEYARRGTGLTLLGIEARVVATPGNSSS